VARWSCPYYLRGQSGQMALSISLERTECPDGLVLQGRERTTEQDALLTDIEDLSEFIRVV